MTRIVKKTMLLLLSLAFICFCSVGCLTACSGSNAQFEAKFKDNVKTEFFVGSSIDVEDYIVPVKDSTYTVSFTYKNNKNEEVTDVLKGVVYYFNYCSDYVMEYKVKVGKKEKSDKLTFTVVADNPTLRFVNFPFNYEVGDRIIFDVFLEYANPVVYPVTSKLKVEKVKYERRTVDLESTLISDSVVEEDLSEKTYYTFEKNGSYTFTVSATDLGKTTYATFKVDVSEDNLGNDDVLMEDGEYASYNAEFNGDVVRLVQAEEANASYVVFNEPLNDTDVVRVEFKGKNMPSFSFLSKPDDSANPWGVYNGTGTTFSFEHGGTDRYDIRLNKKYSGSFVQGGAIGENGLDIFDPEKYYAVEANIVSGSSTNVIHDENNQKDYVVEFIQFALLEIVDYGTPNQSYNLIKTERRAWTNELSNARDSGYLILYGSTKRDIYFRYCLPQVVDAESVQFNAENKTVTWDALDNGLYYTTFGGEYSAPTRENSCSVTEEKCANFFIKTAYYGQPMATPVAALPEGYDENVYTTGGVSNIYYEKNGSDYIENATIPFRSDVSQNYIATTDDYDVGTYVRLDFKGENFPGMIIFGASNLTTDNGNFRGAGNILGYGLSLSNNATMLSTYKCTAAGSGTAGYLTSNLVSGDVNYFNNNYFYRVDKNVNPDISVTTATGGSEKEFIALVGSKIDHVNRIILEYYLYEKNSDGTATLIETNTTNAGLIGCKGTAYQSMPVINTVGKIVVTGDYLVSANTVTKVSAYKPDTLENLQKNITTPLDKLYYQYGASNAVLNEDGTLSAEIPFGATTTNFIATKTDYDVGTYVRLDFKGENFPGMIIFGASNLVTDNGNFRGTGKILGYGLSISNNATMLSTYKCTVAGSGTASFLTSDYVSGEVNYFNNNYFYRVDKNVNPDTSVTTAKGGSEKEFIALVGSKIDNENRIILEYYLYEKNSDGTATLLETNTTNAGLIGCKGTAYDTMPVINTVGKIVVTGDCMVSDSLVTKITMHTPNTLENLKNSIK